MFQFVIRRSTALPLVNGDKGHCVRVLFDSGSQKCFVTPKLVERAGLKVIRSESLGIRAFGASEADRAERKVVELELHSLSGVEKVKVEAYVCS